MHLPKDRHEAQGWYVFGATDRQSAHCTGGTRSPPVIP